MYLRASLTSAGQPNIGRFGASVIGVLTRRAARFSRAARAWRAAPARVAQLFFLNVALLCSRPCGAGTLKAGRLIARRLTQPAANMIRES